VSFCCASDVGKNGIAQKAESNAKTRGRCRGWRAAVSIACRVCRQVQTQRGWAVRIFPIRTVDKLRFWGVEPVRSQCAIHSSGQQRATTTDNSATALAAVLSLRGGQGHPCCRHSGVRLACRVCRGPLGACYRRHHHLWELRGAMLTTSRLRPCTIMFRSCSLLASCIHERAVYHDVSILCCFSLLGTIWRGSRNSTSARQWPLSPRHALGVIFRRV
jgi:hypothetical protein